MSIKKLLLFALFLTLFSCSSYIQTDYSRISSKITSSVLKEISKKYTIEDVSMGGELMYDVKTLDLGVGIQKECSLEEARELLVYYVEKYLKKINQNKKIRPYLHQYPFTYNNVHVNIGFMKEGGQEFYDDVGCVSVVKGTVYYYKDGGDSLVDLYQESYPKALEIVRKQREINDENYQNENSSTIPK